MGFRQDIAGQEIQPIEDRRIELHDIGDHLFAFDPVVGWRAPDELDQTAGFRVCDVGKALRHILSSEIGAVIPFHPVAHRLPDLHPFLVPAPFGQQPGGGRQVGLLQDVLFEDRMINALNGGAHRTGADGRIPTGQGDVVSNHQFINLLGDRGQA